MGTATISTGDTYIGAIVLTGAVTGTAISGTIATIMGTSVALPGSPTTTTQLITDNSTKIATTEFVQGAAAAAASSVNSALSVDVASTTNIVGTYANVGSGIGDTYTVTATGLLTVDGQTLTIGKVFFAKDFTGGPHVGSYNGIYTVTTAGSLGVSTILTRATNYNQPSNINNTGAIQVKTGTVNAGTSWLLATRVTSVGVDALTYNIFTPAYATILTTANAVTPSQGGTGIANNNASTLAISGNFATTITVTGITAVTLPTSGTLVNNTVATLSSLTSVGTIGTGVWQGTVVGGTYGGTGVNNGASTLTLGGSVTHTGAFTTAFTTTNTTAVTLPTSGTLLSTAAAVTPSQGGTGIANNNASTLAISGNFATTLTVTGITAVTLPTSGTLLANTLPSADIFVGNGSNVATGVAMSGDVTISNAGVTTVGNIGGKAISLAAAFTQSGAFATTLTSTAISNATLPIGTTTLLANALPSADIFVGNGSNVATGVAMSGDITITNAGVTAIKSGVALAGIPTAATAAAGTNTTQVATTAFATTAAANAAAQSNAGDAVTAATTSASNTSGLTYLNGVSGVGATFTGSINTALVFDGRTITSGQAVLIKNDTQTTGGAAAGAFNGIYNLTQVQTIGLPPILTRALSYDQASDINALGLIYVQNGTVQAGQSYVLTAPITTLGTDALVYGLGANAASSMALLNTSNSYTAQQNFTSVSTASSSNLTAWNLATAQTAHQLMTENTTLSNPSNAVNGGTYIFQFIQNSGAAKTLSFGTHYLWNASGAPIISVTLSSVLVLTFVSDGTFMRGGFVQYAS